MDLLAENYNPEANLDDDNCQFIYGCLLEFFPNYNSEATMDDGIDINSSDIYGCTDSSYLEWNQYANIDNGSCNSLIILDVQILYPVISI